MPTPLRAAFCGALTCIGLLGSVCMAQADGPGANDQTPIKPEVAVLLHKATTVYKRMKSYHHTAYLTVVGRSEKGPVKNTLRFTLALERPNKFCYKLNTFDQVAAISDGRIFTNFEGQLGEYMQTRAPATYKDFNIVDDVLFQPMATYVVALMLQGDALADADVREAFQKASLGRIVSEDGNKWQIVIAPFNRRTAPFALYFNLKTYRLDKAVLQLSEPPIALTETLDDIKINRPLPSSLFQYTPPPGAKRVERFRNVRPDAIENFVGKPAPDFTLRDRAGKQVSLSDFQGSVVVLNFWASYCGMCPQYLAMMQAMHDRLAEKEVVVLTVATWDSREDTDSFLKDHPEFTLPMLMDPAGKESEKSVASRLYHVKALPTTLILDKKGVVQKVLTGVQEQDAYLDALQEAGISAAP